MSLGTAEMVAVVGEMVVLDGAFHPLQDVKRNANMASLPPPCDGANVDGNRLGQEPALGDVGGGTHTLPDTNAASDEPQTELEMGM